MKFDVNQMMERNARLNCKICGKNIFENSHYIDGEYYHNDCIKKMSDNYTEEMYCTQYNLEQDCFTIDELDGIIKDNGMNALKGINDGYQIIEIGTYEECERAIVEFSETLKHKREEREETKCE